MRKLLSALAIAGIASSAGFTFSEASAQSREVTLLKNPGCQCCDGYADYLRHNGFSVTVKAAHDLAQMSRTAGIPDDRAEERRVGKEWDRPCRSRWWP